MNKIYLYLRPTLDAGGCIAIQVNKTFTSKLIAKSNCPNVIITEIQIVGPFGMTYSQTQPLSGTTDKYYSDLTWAPTSGDSGGNLICTVATDQNGMSSDFQCFTILVGGASPELVNTTESPIGTLSSSYLWGINGYMNYRISFTEAVKRPTDDAYIHFYLKNGTKIAKLNACNSTQVTFSGDTIDFDFPTYTFQPGDYYVTFDLGVGVGSRSKPW
jgi:hypothetical protein